MADLSCSWCDIPITLSGARAVNRNEISDFRRVPIQKFPIMDMIFLFQIPNFRFPIFPKFFGMDSELDKTFLEFPISDPNGLRNFFSFFRCI